jgi:DNA-binding GntR family transcriptional regulator
MAGSSLSERIAHEITKRIHGGELPPDAHLSTQKLADNFRVSRSPVREALQLLADKGVLEQRANRGFFVKPGIQIPQSSADLADHSDAPEKYYRFAEDWLQNKIPQELTEQFLRDRYELTKAQTIELLSRAANEGWVERKDGYGWRLISVAKTPEALAQIYRFRAIIEPANLLEPAFRLDRTVAAEQRRVMDGLLAGGVERWPGARLIDSGVVFHEALARMSGNPLFLQSLIRVNRLRRLIDYRTLIDRERFYQQARDHLHMLDLLERGEALECSYVMKRHLSEAMVRKNHVHEEIAKHRR